MIKKRFFILIATFFIVAACEKAPVNPIPDYMVRLDLDLMFQDKDLVGLFTSKSFTQPRVETDRLGFGGILVTHGLELDFYAYDLACPHEISPSVRIEVTDGGLKAKCPECGSVYDITGGGARISGPSEYNLKQYRVSYSGGDRYVVRN